MTIHPFVVIGIILLVTACQNQLMPSTPGPSQSTVADGLPLTPTITFTAIHNDQPAGTITSSPFPALPSTADPAAQIPLPRLAPGVHLKILSIKLLPDGSGWALGGENDLPTRVLFTPDLGATWIERTPLEPAHLPGSPEKTAVGYFYDRQHAWITFSPPEPSRTDQSVVWLTEDGGITWTASQVLTGARADTVYSPTEFFFTDAQHGWLMSHHGAAAGHTPVSIYKTSDGGNTWEVVARPMDEISFPLHACCQSGMIFFDDNLTGIVARDGGPIPTPHILRTQDSGLTWQQHDLPELGEGLFETHYCTTSSLQRVSGHSASFVMNCSDFTSEGSHQAFQFITEDSGESWNWLPLPEPTWPLEWANVTSTSEVQWVDQDTQFLFTRAYYEIPPNTIGNNATHIFLKLSGEIDWESQGFTYWQGQFSFIDETKGLAIARSGLETALVLTQNGGQTWNMLDPVLEK